VHGGPKADGCAEATGLGHLQRAAANEGAGNAHHGETVLVGKPPPGVDSVLRWILRPARIVTGMSTAMNAMRTGPRRVVHLELHTGDQVRAGAFYAELLQWRPELVRAGSGCYLAVDLGPAVGGGIIECQTRRPLWLPYAEVERIDDATEHARRLGAAVLLEPREGPSGWRSVVSSPVAGEVALWQPKR